MHQQDIGEWLERPHHYCIRQDDADYPPLLRETSGAPAELYVRGDPAVLSRPGIAIVGSRNSTPYGREMAFRLGAELASRGFVVCSGLATGIDTEAHRAALKAGAPTVAVLGNGLLDVYPPANRSLADAIVASHPVTQGALVSELPLDAPPLPTHFPSRNRIISGLSLGVCVVEANIRSGSLITARLALEQNREVFAVPGSVNSTRSRGCHQLLRQGAVLVESADDILAHVETLYRGQLDLMSQPHVTATADHAAACEPDVPSESAADCPVLACIGDDAMSIDALVQRTGLDVSQLSQQLLTLELAGKIHRQGSRWCRNGGRRNR